MTTTHNIGTCFAIAFLTAALFSGPPSAFAVSPVSVENTEPVRVSVDSETIAGLAAAIASASAGSQSRIATVSVNSVGTFSSGALDALLSIGALGLGVGLMVVVLTVRGRL